MNLNNSDKFPDGSRVNVEGDVWVKIKYNAQFAISHGSWVNTTNGVIQHGSVLLKNGYVSVGM